MRTYFFLSLLFLELLSLFTQTVHGATFYQIQGGLRSTPQSASIEAQFFYNEKLWSGVGEGDSIWKYGFWRVGGFVATHGQAGIKVEVFPISIWQIQIQRSITSRFYETQTLNCDVVECRGLLQRGTFKTSLALGYGDYFLVPSYMVTDLSHNSNQKDFSSEEDNLVAERSGDQVITTQVALGLKYQDQKWVLVSKDSRMKNSRDTNSAQYLIWSQSQDKSWNYFVGAGAYRSDYLKSSLSVVLGASWMVGENLSFF